MPLFTQQEALDYHRVPRPGKLENLPTKSCKNQKDLSLAYSPGVAEACLAVQKNPADAAIYTNRSNLVGVVSNGTAVLGLGDIGPLAGKPVMEGKGVLFKVFADVDAYDINLDAREPRRVIDIVKALEPTFGGINLEDIKGPDCFEIEAELKATMKIPVFHDDQHGTAIISGAGLLNGAKISGVKLEDMRIVVSGAGAAGIACARFYVELGVDPKNIFMFDSKGLITRSRGQLSSYKAEFAQTRDCAMAEALKGANLFLGLSRKGILHPDMIMGMAKNPLIFACANPAPEIEPAVAKAARPDCIVGTGRSDYPNQINNVSGFPYIFRGALDVRATTINEAMKVAASKAIAALAEEPVDEAVSAAYDGAHFSFGLDYILPKPFDPRLIERETVAVANAAMETGVAQAPIADLDAYRRSLRPRLAAARARAEALYRSYL